MEQQKKNILSRSVVSKPSLGSKRKFLFNDYLSDLGSLSISSPLPFLSSPNLSLSLSFFFFRWENGADEAEKYFKILKKIITEETHPLRRQGLDFSLPIYSAGIFSISFIL